MKSRFTPRIAPSQFAPSRYAPSRYAPPRYDSPEDFLYKVADLLEEITPGTKENFVPFVKNIWSSSSFTHSQRSRSASRSASRSPGNSNTQKKINGGYKWRSSRKSAYSRKYSRRQSGGSITRNKFLLTIFLAGLFLLYFHGKNTYIPAHEPLFNKPITVSTVIERMNHSNPEWGNFFKLPQITAIAARAAGSFLEISKILEAVNNEGMVSSQILSNCYTTENPIIRFIDFMQVSLVREKYYCKTTPNIDDCIKNFFGFGVGRLKENSKIDDKYMIGFDTEIVNFINNFYLTLEKIIKEYKSNETQYNKANYSYFSAKFLSSIGMVGMIFLVIPVFLLIGDGKVEVEKTRARKEKEAEEQALTKRKEIEQINKEIEERAARNLIRSKILENANNILENIRYEDEFY
jgi:hypothetical protein